MYYIYFCIQKIQHDFIWAEAEQLFKPFKA